ncbi:hypothetical protein E2C01_000734 [Portunus trituberculatus]|uniref:Uncharacterized protein n=1 Tax=Portunus trituberculatus TaxID=210409 RepID=A0A5B7CFF6_PORTR|nr:hypothetical protein [Portunus trituberculatus]
MEAHQHSAKSVARLDAAVGGAAMMGRRAGGRGASRALPKTLARFGCAEPEGLTTPTDFVETGTQAAPSPSFTSPLSQYKVMSTWLEGKQLQIIVLAFFSDSQREFWEHETTVRDDDLLDWVMVHGSAHHIHAAHHLAEGTGEGGACLTSRADAKAVLVNELAEWDEESLARLLAVLVIPLQVSQQLLHAPSVAFRPVFSAAQRFFRPALVRHVTEARPDVRWSHRAHAECQELLGSA